MAANTRQVPVGSHGVNDLVAMPYPQFKEVVEAECKGTAPEKTAAALRDPAVTARWYETLIGIQKSVEGQLAALGAEVRHKAAKANAKIAQIEGRFEGATAQEATKEAQSQLRRNRQERLEAEAELELWRSRAIRFKTGIEERLAEVKSLLHEQGHFETDLVNERNAALARVLTLENAIRTWRDSFVPDEATPEDLELMKHVGH